MRSWQVARRYDQVGCTALLYSNCGGQAMLWVHHPLRRDAAGSSVLQNSTVSLSLDTFSADPCFSVRIRASKMIDVPSDVSKIAQVMLFHKYISLVQSIIFRTPIRTQNRDLLKVSLKHETLHLQASQIGLGNSRDSQRVF